MFWNGELLNENVRCYIAKYFIERMCPAGKCGSPVTAGSDLCLLVWEKSVFRKLNGLEGSLVKVKVHLCCCISCVENSIVRVKVHTGLVAGLS